jgi:hypothetical protein
MRPKMLRVQTSFQDTPGDGYYFVLLHDERPLVEQVETLELRDGDAVLLWEPDCGDFTVEAILLFNFKHPMMLEPGLWAKASLQTQTLPRATASRAVSAEAPRRAARIRAMTLANA